MNVTGWGTFPVKVQGWEHFSTDIRSLSFLHPSFFILEVARELSLNAVSFAELEGYISQF